MTQETFWFIFVSILIISACFYQCLWIFSAAKALLWWESTNLPFLSSILSSLNYKWFFSIYIIQNVFQSCWCISHNYFPSYDIHIIPIALVNTKMWNMCMCVYQCKYAQTIEKLHWSPRGPSFNLRITTVSQMLSNGNFLNRIIYII